MELLYNLTPLCGSDFPSIGNRRKIRSNSDPINHSSSTSKNSKIFIRTLFKINHRAEREMDCLRGPGSTPTFLMASYETLPKSFFRSRDRQSFWRRSFHSVRKNVVRQSERFMGKHFKSKSKRSRGQVPNNNNNNNKILHNLKNFSTYNDRTLPNSAVCDIALSTDNNSSVPDATSKNRQSR